MPCSSPVEQRRAPRRSALLPCEVLSDVWEEPLELQARDLSTLGVWLETDLPLDPGDLVVIGLQLPDDPEEHLVSGIVRRAELHDTDGCPSGMAVEFDRLDPPTIRALERSLAKRPPALPRPIDPSSECRALRDLTVRVTYEERLDDRINIYEADELVQLIEDETPVVVLGPLLS